MKKIQRFNLLKNTNQLSEYYVRYSTQLQLLMFQNFRKETAMKSLQYIELNEVASACHLSQDELIEMLEYDIIPFSSADSGELRIDISWIDALRKAAQIRRDYALDLFTMGILVNYLQRIADLEKLNLNLQTKVAECSQ